MPMFNVAIIEDDLILRRALSDYFERSTQIDCVLAVDTVEQFIKFHRDFLNIHLVLLDVNLYDRSSIPDIPMIQEREPEAEIIMYTVMDDADTIFHQVDRVSGVRMELAQSSSPHPRIGSVVFQGLHGHVCQRSSVCEFQIAGADEQLPADK